MSRKTVDVVAMLTFANAQLKRENMSDDYRLGVIRMIEDTLHFTNTYAGFNYLAWCDEGGHDAWRAAGEPKDNMVYLGNQTRRVYYQHRSLSVVS